MYKLIGSLKTRAFRVAWMLTELEADYDLDPVRPRDPVAAAINPSGKVPVLIDSGEAIIDSVAICQYLADKHQRFTAKAGTIDRARQDSFTQLAVDDLEGPLWTAAKHTFVFPAEYRVDAVKASCRYDFSRGVETFSKRLGDHDYVMGNTFTVPDLLITHCLTWAQGMGFEVTGEAVGAYLDRMRNRPAYQRVKAKVG